MHSVCYDLLLHIGTFGLALYCSVLNETTDICITVHLNLVFMEKTREMECDLSLQKK